MLSFYRSETNKDCSYELTIHKWSNGSNKFLISDSPVIIFIKPLEKKPQILFNGVEIRLLDKGSEIVDVESPFTHFVNGCECGVVVYLQFIADSLSHQFDAYLAVHVSLDEHFKEIPSWALKVLGEVFLTAIEATSRLQKDRVLVSSRHEAV